MGVSRAHFFAACAIAWTAVTPVHADEAGKAKAQALFTEGRAAIEKGDNATGCAKMRESLGIFAVANTLFNVAQCDEGEGRIAAALEHWERGLALVEAKDKRAAVAKERIAALSPRVPRLRIVVPPGKNISVILLDDQEMSPAALADALKMEPGKHVIVVTSPGRKDRRHEVTLAENERTEFVATPSDELSPDPNSGEVVPNPGETKLMPMHPRKKAGFIVGGVGVAGLVAAGITSLLVKSKAGDLDSCPPATTPLDTPCRLTYREQVDAYKRLLVGNAVAWGVGAAGLGTGLILMLTVQKAKDEGEAKTAIVPLFWPGGAGVGLSGRF